MINEMFDYFKNKCFKFIDVIVGFRRFYRKSFKFWNNFVKFFLIDWSIFWV